MILKRFVFIVSVIVLSGLSAAFGQGGSNYSIFGIGDINYSGNASYSALGGTQIAFPSENSINSRNPSMWSFVTSTRLQAGYKFNQNVVSDANNTIWHNNGALSGFSGIFAIDSSNGIAASFGIVPYSNINYLTSTITKINDMGLDLEGETKYQGSGGISQAYFGLASKLTDRIGVGASVYSTFGVVNSKRETSFEKDYYSFKYTSQKSDYFSGIGIKTGAFINPADGWLVGISYELNPRTSISSENNFKSPTIPDTTLKSESKIEIPSLLGFGASYSTGNFVIGADFSMQDFTGFNFNTGSNTEFTNSYLASIGVNRIGNPSLNAAFADRIAYKFGIGYQQLYFKVLGNQIREYTASVGMQMPFSGSMVVDFSFALGYRMSGDSRLVNEYFGRFGIDVSMGETWFQPFFRDF